MRQLEEENRKLKQLVADLSLDKAMLQAVVAKKSLRPSQRREWVPELMQRFGCSQRNALRIIGMSCSTYLYRSVKRDESALKLRIREITQTRVHYGYRRVHVMLRREGHTDNVVAENKCVTLVPINVSIRIELRCESAGSPHCACVLAKTP